MGFEWEERHGRGGSAARPPVRSTAGGGASTSTPSTGSMAGGALGSGIGWVLGEAGDIIDGWLHGGSPTPGPLSTSLDGPSLDGPRPGPLSTSLDGPRPGPLSTSLDGPRPGPLSTSLDGPRPGPLSTSLDEIGAKRRGGR